MRKTLCIATALLVLCSAAILPAENAKDEPVVVKIDNFSFGPQKLTIPAETTVTWLNEDDVPHNVVSTAKTFKSEVLDTGDRFSYTFKTPGSYDYFCGLHPHMKGLVVVR